MGITDGLMKGGISMGITVLSNSYPALSPVLTVLQPVCEDLVERMLSAKENERVRITSIETIKKIQEKIERGDTPRGDDFWDSNTEGVCNAEILFEGVLLKARDEFEEKKRRYYPNFCCNMCFAEDISYERLNTLLRILNQLNYRQLQLLEYIRKNSEIDTVLWEARMKLYEEAYKYYDILSEVYDLYNKALLQQMSNGVTMGISSKLKLSPLGVDLIRLLELDKMPHLEIINLTQCIDAINAIIQRH